jgi:hypothetical protein
MNPENNKQQNFKLCLSDEQSMINDMMLPCKIMSFWDGDSHFEVEPQRAETNPHIADATFSLKEK